MNKPLLGRALVVLALVFLSATSYAALIAPIGLVPGDRFHIIFVTSATTDAYSSDIATYDAFAQAIAESAGIGSEIGLTGWRALVSTPTVNAIDHIAPLFNDPTNLSIHNLNPGSGTNLISSSLADFWLNGATNSVVYDENGIGVYGDVWTGTLPNGSLDPDYALGSSTLLSRFGFPYNASQVISAAPLGYTDQGKQNHIYAVSQELIVLDSREVAISAVPVPAAFWLFGSGLIGLIGLARRKVRN